MDRVEICVIGGGPAGMCAAISAAECGAEVLLLDDNDRLGGQLIKQTHRFFGSEKHHASVRGFEIAALLERRMADISGLKVRQGACVIGVFDDDIIAYVRDDATYRVKAGRIIVAAGATEKALAFPGCDLPGVYGAGAVQTLMNLHGVKPAERVIMVGAGNIGLIVTYQLLQAGVEVAAVVEASENVGGYWVHADKIRRFGVPILTKHTILRAEGRDEVTSAVIAEVDRQFKVIEGTQRVMACDTICLAVGLTPLVDLLWQAGCELGYVAELGGHVPIRDSSMRSTRNSIFVAGDLAGVEEASAAMVEGHLAGLTAAADIGRSPADINDRIRNWEHQLGLLREGPKGEKTRAGILKMSILSGSDQPVFHLPATDKPSHIFDENLYSRMKGPRAVVECYEQIPCNPCVRACPVGALNFPEGDSIVQTPVVHVEKCTGCLKCLYRCPGLAMFAVDYSLPGTEGLLYIPWEMTPLPNAGEAVELLNRQGAREGRGTVERIIRGKAMDRTTIVVLKMDRGLLSSVRGFRPLRLDDPVICRCEDIKKSEILRAVRSGLHSFDELKKVLRCGMGTCQGRTCQDMILRIISGETGIPLDKLQGQKKRPPTKPIRLGVLANDGDDGNTSGGNTSGRNSSVGISGGRDGDCDKTVCGCGNSGTGSDNQ
ncbi:MAG: (2Fe-2S)-binding protein [Candidatus Wallbacteria bacterium HGW-Wallbacteria-1]|jgi:NADPH-dependent 2,4-dienoyl-CoA reductase/sulfur reductase-like enzyme/Fe-S-cluster-containing hydrogenase component 2/bacterioferritin-associated ferredoxin|uniref:(2Fe-2S)-binding protein n=1 Tax=Candidatus Wallbacteria bacterium HGW-Wallbacteria-1 TaxID=2013854 RepID=A0A2N1PU65_9BACT|nr:MAG: (2Fe-2S)-binding protein [Candidatus Wallbacteria bacterium HGW-Wallbacteria-1]